MSHLLSSFCLKTHQRFVNTKIHNFSVRNYLSSALYITGDKASKTYAVLTPHIDFEERLDNIEELQRNINIRGLCYEVRNIAAYYYLYKEVIYKKTALEFTRAEVGKRVGKLMKDPEKNSLEIEHLKGPSFIAKHHHRALKEYSYTAEEIAMSKILSLPNILHERTPHDSDEISYTYLKKPEYESPSNIIVGTKWDLIDYHNPTYFFFKNEAALFDLSIMNYFQNFLIDSGYSQFSNCDFSRSVIVEGCGTDFYSKFEAFTLEDPHETMERENFRLHLTGGSSLYGFMAYFAKNSIQASYFPLKHFCAGRTYKPVVKDEFNLLNVEQSNAVTLFTVTADDDVLMDEEFDRILEQIKKLYDSLGYHYRIVYLQANQIDKAESLRVSIQMYSCFLKKYTEIAHISIYDQYLCKRLLLTYNVNKQMRFPRIIFGTVLNVNKLLGCILEGEGMNKEHLISPLLKDYVPL